MIPSTTQSFIFCAEQLLFKSTVQYLKIVLYLKRVLYSTWRHTHRSYNHQIQTESIFVDKLDRRPDGNMQTNKSRQETNPAKFERSKSYRWHNAQCPSWKILRKKIYWKKCVFCSVFNQIEWHFHKILAILTPWKYNNLDKNKYPKNEENVIFFPETIGDLTAIICVHFLHEAAT